MVEFSIVCPVRDEIHLIPITLPSYYALNPSEVILCLDKPAPLETIEAIKRVAQACEQVDRTRIIEVERNPEYKFHQAWVRRTGYWSSKEEIVLTTDVDLVLDPRITDYLPLIREEVGLVSFNKLAYPPTFRSCVANLVQKLYHHQSFTGLYAFSKKAWLETEDIEHLKKQITRAEDTHLHYYMSKKYRTLFITGLKTYCLRPHESRSYQISQGVNRWVIRKNSLPKVLVSTIIYMRPWLLVGYLQARFGILPSKVKG